MHDAVEGSTRLSEVTGMPASRDWLQYFQFNFGNLLAIPWERGAELDPAETAAISRSLSEFQAGENSEGKHLLRYAQEYAERSGDLDYVPAIRLFIAEEQRHARDLGRFLTLNGIQLVRTTFTDRVFRRLRNLLGGLEISVRVLITAEIIAKVYYAVLRDATRSVILQRLCDQILNDELRHVQFQSEQLEKLSAGRGRWGLAVSIALQRALYVGTVLVVWWFHRPVIQRGGLSLVGWWRSCWREFDGAFAPAGERARILLPGTSASAIRN